MASLIQDLAVYLWGVFIKHPNVVETEFAVVPPVCMKRLSSAYGHRFEITFQFPRIFILNAYEMRQDFQQKGPTVAVGPNS